jgi:hypothetical protein
VVRELVAVENPSIVCLEETNLHVLNDFLVMEILGLSFGYASLPADNTRGGILVAWLSLVCLASSVSSKAFSVLVRLWHISLSEDWWLMGVYGPSRDHDKPKFLAELEELCHLRYGPWLLTGNFNLIYRAEDKSNDHLDQ